MRYTFLIMIHTIFFDLDNTLYASDSGIWEAIGARINLFMTEILGISEDEVTPLRIKFHKEFSTTLMGLKSMFEVDEMEYLNFVHDVDLNAMLYDDGQLKKMLMEIPQRKIIFTNSDNAHASRVLSFFDIQGFFDLVVDVIAMKPYVKPEPQAYQIALDMAGLASPQGCMFIDDMVENVEQASKSGFHAVYIGNQSLALPSIQHIYELPGLLEKI